MSARIGRDGWALAIPMLGVWVVWRAASRLAAMASGGSPLGAWPAAATWLGALAAVSGLVVPLRRWWYAEVADAPPPLGRGTRAACWLAWIASLLSWVAVVWTSETTRLFR